MGLGLLLWLENCALHFGMTCCQMQSTLKIHDFNHTTYNNNNITKKRSRLYVAICWIFGSWIVGIIILGWNCGDHPTIQMFYTRLPLIRIIIIIFCFYGVCLAPFRFLCLYKYTTQRGKYDRCEMIHEFRLCFVYGN